MNLFLNFHFGLLHNREILAFPEYRLIKEGTLGPLMNMIDIRSVPQIYNISMNSYTITAVDPVKKVRPVVS